MAKKIKGLTVEIGGDTTKLGDALRKVEKNSEDLSSELKDVNKLLKFDPQNSELLAQKQKILSAAIDESKNKLEILKEAEKSVIKQFEEGKISEDQLRAFQREIIATTNSLKSDELQAEKTAKAIENLGKIGEKVKTLRSTIEEQSSALSKLKGRYAEVAATQGKNSSEAKALASQIKSLSGEFNENQEKMRKAEEAANKLDKSYDNTEKSSGRLKETLKNVTAAAVAVSAAVGAAALKLTKEVIEAYGEQEQLIGGVETLFGAGGQSLDEYAKSVGKSSKAAENDYNNLLKAQKTVITNANMAYKTAGMSANEYMDTVTSFSASLISSLNGDTVAAAKAADTAIVDMSDNANKMGTDISSIQDAYQGFAKQNYTMLDNLKLGYGGTKKEMERLLADAQKISGQKYDIDNLNDVYSAIHVIQTEMGITDTTAKEAATTIQGSIGSLKSAVGNLIAGLGDADADVKMLTDNVVDAFKTVRKNITPVIQNIISALPTAVNAIIEALGSLLPSILDSATELFSQILSTVVGLLPELVSAIADFAVSIADTVVGMLPQILTATLNVLTAVIDG